MSKFKVGEIVIFVDSDDIHKHLIGNECEVLELIDKTWSSYPTNQFYLISLEHNGNGIGCSEDCLRKKPPEETTTWEAIEAEHGWNPTKEKVNAI